MPFAHAEVEAGTGRPLLQLTKEGGTWFVDAGAWLPGDERIYEGDIAPHYPKRTIVYEGEVREAWTNETPERPADTAWIVLT